MNYYVNIEEMPLYNWEKCQDGDLTFIRKDILLGSEEQDFKAWELLQYDYMERFGVSTKHARFSILQRDLLVLKLEKIIGEDRFIDSKIDDLQDEIKSFFSSNVQERNIMDKTLIHLNKEYNCGLDKKKISVFHFYLMIEEYGKKN